MTHDASSSSSRHASLQLQSSSCSASTAFRGRAADTRVGTYVDSHEFGELDAISHLTGRYEGGSDEDSGDDRDDDDDDDGVDDGGDDGGGSGGSVVEDDVVAGERDGGLFVPDVGGRRPQMSDTEFMAMREEMLGGCRPSAAATANIMQVRTHGRCMCMSLMHAHVCVICAHACARWYACMPLFAADQLPVDTHLGVFALRGLASWLGVVPPRA
jgi:hypothetical protein